jgi:hypothetical protein
VLRRPALFGILIVMAVAFTACGGGNSTSERHESAQAEERDHGESASEREREAEELKSGHRTLFESDRRPDHTPAAEAVEDRAYPRTYVETKRALAGRAAVDRARTRGAEARARTRTATTRAATRAALTTTWQEAGPFTPDVPARVTYTGRASKDSGRVTAEAIDPNCGTAGNGCRVWVGAAGGGVWRSDDALAATPTWSPKSDGIPSNAVGSLTVDPTDPTGNTLYVGTGEPNGSGDSEAGVGLYKSTNGGDSWTLVGGSRDVAIDRAIGTVLIDPSNKNHLFIGTDVARHGSSSANGGRRTPPGAPTLGVYESTDGGTSFSLAFSRPANPSPPAEGNDWFQGGVNKMLADPVDRTSVYAAIQGYGIWRRAPHLDGDSDWHPVFATRNPKDTFGDRTEFSLTRTNGHTRMYVGDSSDDQGIAELWRTDQADQAAKKLSNGKSNAGAFKRLSNKANGTPGYTSYNYCQNGQCGYDDFVEVDPTNPDVVWLGGSMAYDELATPGQVTRSNGRAVVRSTNAGVSFTDMTDDARTPPAGMHPDQHAIVFDPKNTGIAFIGSDGGVVRTNGTFVDTSSDCASRNLPKPADVADCKLLLSSIPQQIDDLNDGLRTLQFQSLTPNPKDSANDVIGGTQDNGTWAFTGSTSSWFESIGGDGGQSAIDFSNPNLRAHTYFDADIDVNHQGNNVNTWDFVSVPLDSSGETASFYIPLIGDPKVSKTMFAGLQHVWRTTDWGGNTGALDTKCRNVDPLGFFPGDEACGDWKALGADLTADSFGDRAGDYVVATERAPSNKGTLWAATRTGRLFVTTNANAANPTKVVWDRIDTDTTPGRFISGISIDPSNPNHAWVSYSGYSAYTPDTPGHVFEVTYRPNAHSATFTDRSSDIGDVPVTDVVLDAATGDVYAATDWAVLRREHGTSTWTTAATGLPPVATYGLSLTPGSRTLWAATHGRGAWKLTLP